MTIPLLGGLSSDWIRRRRPIDCTETVPGTCDYVIPGQANQETKNSAMKQTNENKVPCLR